MNPDFNLTYRRFFPLLVRKCARTLGDSQEAQDVAQDTFLRLQKAGLSLSDARALSAWLYRTSTRLAIDRLRLRARHTGDHALENLPSGLSPEHSAQVAQLWTGIVRRVPQEELEVALLTHVDGLKQTEIAEVLSIHERSVRRLLAKFDERALRMRERSER